MKFRDAHSMKSSKSYGSLEFSTRPANYEGSIMSMATREVVTVPPTMTIKGAAETMTNYGFRRLPVCDPGTNRLLGIIGSSDIIDFLGGGKKSLLINKKYGGNFLAAINESVRAVMETDVVTLGRGDKISDALALMLKTRVGGVVIVSEERKVEGIVTEKDFVSLLAGKTTGKKVADYMTRKVVTLPIKASLGDACKTMVKNSFRRLPVTKDEKLAGIITTRMVIEFIGRNHVFSKIVKNRIGEILETPIRDMMKKEVPTLGGSMDLGSAARSMGEAGTGTVCIVENEKLVGILTERDVARALAE